MYVTLLWGYASLPAGSIIIVIEKERLAIKDRFLLDITFEVKNVCIVKVHELGVFVVRFSATSFRESNKMRYFFVWRLDC